MKKQKGNVVKKPKILVMNNTIKSTYLYIYIYIYIYIRPKNLHKISLENLGIRNLGNSIHEGCLKKKKNNVRYSRFIF